MPDEYDTFLGSGDLTTWLQCASTLEARALGAPAREEDLRKAVFVAIYTRWLCKESGALQHGATLDDALGRLADATRRAYRGNRAGTETRLAMGALMAWRGYGAAAEEMMRSVGPLRPEAAVLVLPTETARRVRFFRHEGLHELEPPFRPALFFYGDALLKLRSLKAIRSLLADHPTLSADPMMLDLQGRLHEEAGRWDRAYETYSYEDPWPKHRYRASISAAISDRQVPATTPPDTALPGDQAPDFVVDAALAAELMPTSYEVDSAELARRNQFLSTCRWKSPDHWVVQLELGHLNFRRRRHVAAHANYSAAAAACPPAARFVVLQTQFANLSWLSGASEHVSMAPETCECGLAAIRAAGAEDRRDAAAAQLWLSQETRDPRDLLFVFDAGEAFERGCAHSMIGDEGQAIRCWIEAITKTCHSRALQRLIGVFVRCRFGHSVGFLIDLALREASDDFQALRELGSNLVAHRNARGIDDARIDVQLDKVFQRIDDLSRHEFQHIFRAHALYLEAGRRNRAATLLIQAAALAEGPEENLAVAKARRELLGAEDTIGLRCLQRAVREAGTRFERLAAAVECMEYGQVRRGRRILDSVGVPDAKRGLEPAEYILAIRCTRWLGKDDARVLVNDAIGALRRDVGRGAFQRYERLFRDRLRLALPPVEDVPVDRDLLDWLEAETDTPETPTEIFLEVDSGRDLIARTLSDAPLHLKLHFWWHVAAQLDGFVASVTKVRPDIAPADTPVSKVTRIEDDLRGQLLSDLWRDFFRASDDGDRNRIQAEIRAFHQRERELLDAWEAKRREAATEALDRALDRNEVAKPILESLRHLPERTACWPMLEGLFDCIERDAEQHLEELATLGVQLREDFSISEIAAAGGAS